MLRNILASLAASALILRALRCIRSMASSMELERMNRLPRIVFSSESILSHFLSTRSILDGLWPAFLRFLITLAVMQKFTNKPKNYSAGNKKGREPNHDLIW